MAIEIQLACEDGHGDGEIEEDPDGKPEAGVGPEIDPWLSHWKQFHEKSHAHDHADGAFYQDGGYIDIIGGAEDGIGFSGEQLEDKAACKKDDQADGQSFDASGFYDRE